jgi:hypothetical protein
MIWACPRDARPGFRLRPVPQRGVTALRVTIPHANRKAADAAQFAKGAEPLACPAARFDA